jgi:hypothetical protein
MAAAPASRRDRQTFLRHLDRIRPARLTWRPKRGLEVLEGFPAGERAEGVGGDEVPYPVGVSAGVLA